MVTVSLIGIDSGPARLELVGDITDAQSLEQGLAALELKAGTPLEIACDRVVYINSVGVKQWILLFESLRLAGTQLSFTDCSTVIVSQMTILPNFILREELVSLHLPYLCPGCNTESTALAKPGELVAQGKLRLPELTCAKCGTALVFDENPTEYLAFLGLKR